MNDSGEIKVSEIWNTSDIDFVFPTGLSFFDSYLQYYVKETIEIGGKAYVYRNSEGAISGIFLYDDSEKSGTIYTRSREVFDYFCELKPFDFLFSEMRAEHESEIYDIYTVHLEHLPLVHTFSYEISVAGKKNVDEIEQFMVSTHPGINRRWVHVALNNGERCFLVRLDNAIGGLGWASIVNRIGRLHSLYVKPQFRRIGIGEDILIARLLWLKSKGARAAFSEISRDNLPSSKIAVKGHMRVSGQIFQYFRRNVEKKRKLRKSASASRF
jgi:GNAT superfamily N-acetyltransferase